MKTTPSAFAALVAIPLAGIILVAAPVRSAAARALGQVGPAAKSALPALEKLRSDPQDYVRQAAAEAVSAITTRTPH
jgi:HEAT repeat protein